MDKTIMINVWIQIINLLIFFFVFKKFFAWPVVEAVEKRKQMLDQFKNADDVLQKKLAEAEEQKQVLINEWLEHKNKLIEQAKQQWEHHRNSILEQAEYEKNTILEKWKQQLSNEKKELEKSWEDSVKRWIYTVYEKLFQEDKDFAKKYTDKIALENIDKK